MTFQLVEDGALKDTVLLDLASPSVPDHLARYRCFQSWYLMGTSLTKYFLSCWDALNSQTGRQTGRQDWKGFSSQKKNDPPYDYRSGSDGAVCLLEDICQEEGELIEMVK